ncbi:MAG: GNAT family N-acetyltransferase [Saprospiraceae bacterium]|nr:GNAT family N-acetyltransferase [Saprospiraceae bacterium]
MKIFFSEGKPHYPSYTFNYGIYCLKELQEELPRIYEQGFLPYSANTQIRGELFYLARSLRVDIDRFQDTSENRRVQRKIAELDITVSCHPKVQFLETHKTFESFCLAYANERIGDHLSVQRFQYICNLETGTHVFNFQSQTLGDVGFVLAAIEGKMLHYWFSFFNVELMRSHSLGKWMMWYVINWAKEQDLEKVYLGTCYGSKSLYKVRDHKGLAFFDGTSWNTDVKLLKIWCKADEERRDDDRLKQASDPNILLKKLKA